jgi:hypothetical protein
LRPFQKRKKKNKKTKLSRREQVTAAAPPPPPIPPTLSHRSHTQPPPDTPDRERLRGSPFGPKGDSLLDDLRRLAVRADADTPGRHSKILPDERREGATKIPGAFKLLQHELAEAGPPSQRTRQMRKDLEKTLLKRYEENKVLEKKRKKEIKKEQP